MPNVHVLTDSATGRRGPLRRYAMLAAALMVTVVPVAAAPSAGASQYDDPAFRPRVPHTVVLDGSRLSDIRRRLHRHPTRAQRSALAALKKAAIAELTAGPWSVVHKKQAPVGGTLHDYYSKAPYWWPTQPKTDSNPYGCPYVRRDGEHNPDVDLITDHHERELAFQAISDLTLAWYYTGDARFARRAVLDVRSWFLDPATAMNPGLNFVQAIPCQVTGRAEGVIDLPDALSPVVDAFALLDSGAPGWGPVARQGVRTSLTSLLTWSQTNPMAQKESTAKNNHGTWKDQMDASIALYLGQTDTARDLVTKVRDKRIPAQIAADGSQPQEIVRTRSWHYATFNAAALCRTAEIGAHLGIDLWGYTAPNGASLTKAVDVLIPTAEKGLSVWPYPEIGPFFQYAANSTLHAAAAEGHDTLAAAALSQVPVTPPVDMWPIEPVCVPYFDTDPNAP